MSSHLPPELILEILHRLPIEAVVKCTSVCKSWNSIIKSTTFISTYLERTISAHDSADSHLLLFRVCTKATPDSSGRPVEHYSLRFDNGGLDEYKQLPFPFSNSCANSCFRVVGSCNGLVCLADDMMSYTKTCILWNPIIHTAILFPEPNVNVVSHGPYDAFLGFGFDSKNNDYKLLRFAELESRSYPRRGKASVEVEIYSLNANCWKSVTHIAPKYGLCLPFQRLYGHSFVNGAIHLLACDRNRPGDKVRNLVLAFDVSEEVFKEISLPECLSNDWLRETEIIKYGQSSIAVITPQGQEFHVWAMKEYGIAMSWTKVLILLNNFLEREGRVLAFRKNEEVLLAMHHGWIASHDTKSKKFGFFGVQSPAGYSYVDNFVESLVLLDNRKHASGALLDERDECLEDDSDE